EVSVRKEHCAKRTILELLAQLVVGNLKPETVGFADEGSVCDQAVGHARQDETDKLRGQLLLLANAIGSALDHLSCNLLVAYTGIDAAARGAGWVAEAGDEIEEHADGDQQQDAPKDVFLHLGRCLQKANHG